MSRKSRMFRAFLAIAGAAAILAGYCEAQDPTLPPAPLETLTPFGPVTATANGQIIQNLLVTATGAVAVGSYTLTAKATDNAGATTTSAGVSITVTSAPVSGTAFITGQALGSPRNNYTGWVGMTFTIGSSALTVTQLGRWVVAGNTQTHTVKLVNAATGADVSGGTASVNTAGAAGGRYKYAALAGPVTLAANARYHLVTYETAGGDWWYDWATRVTTTPVARTAGPVYGSVAGVWYPGTYSAMAAETLTVLEEGGMVSIVGVSTSRPYSLATAVVGALPYIDRSYTITALSAALTDGVLARTAMDDKNGSAADHLTLTLGGNAGAESNYFVVIQPTSAAAPLLVEGPVLATGWVNEEDGDGDGLKDAFEEQQGLDVAAADTDGDEVPDEAELPQDGRTYWEVQAEGLALKPAAPAGGGRKRVCGATGMESVILPGLLHLLRRRKTRR